MRKARNLIYALVAACCLAGGGAAIAATTASAAVTTASATTTITGRDDSGNNGNWAKDAMTRTVSATLVGLHAGPECDGLNVSGPNTCYQFTGSVEDTNGTFATDVGAFTPNQSTPGTHIAGEGALDGTFFGGSASGFTFYASSNALSTARVPGSVTGDGPVGTSEWISLLFPADTGFAGDLLPGWSWSYTEPVFCGHWVDAFNNGDGNLAGDGNITGVSQCTISLTNPGNQATQVNTSVSLQIKASTTSADKTLHYSLTGQPAGATINAATGLITGKPTVVENTDVASVTVTDGVGSAPQTVTFGWSVTATPPPTPAHLTLLSCTSPNSAHRWKVSDTGGTPTSFTLFSKVGTSYLFDGTGSVKAHSSTIAISRRPRATGAEIRYKVGGKFVAVITPNSPSHAC